MKRNRNNLIMQSVKLTFVTVSTAILYMHYAFLDFKSVLFVELLIIRCYRSSDEREIKIPRTIYMHRVCREP